MGQFINRFSALVVAATILSANAIAQVEDPEYLKFYQSFYAEHYKQFKKITPPKMLVMCEDKKDWRESRPGFVYSLRHRPSYNELYSEASDMCALSNTRPRIIETVMQEKMKR